MLRLRNSSAFLPAGPAVVPGPEVSRTRGGLHAKQVDGRRSALTPTGALGSH